MFIRAQVHRFHHETASEFFKKLYDDGKFIEKTSEQYYDEENKQFLADRYIIGTCPKCGFEKAYGDQCESCGTSLSPTELINPTSTISGNKPVFKKKPSTGICRLMSTNHGFVSGF